MARRGQTYTKEFNDSTIQLALNSEKSHSKYYKANLIPLVVHMYMMIKHFEF